MLVLTLAFAGSVIPSVAAAPTLTTDQPLYTTRDKQVAIVGSGYLTTQTYYVWVRTPADNSTHFSGISFTPVSGGLIPPSVALPLDVDLPLGTYTLSISTVPSSDNAQARAHFGLWGTSRPLYQRTQSVAIFGGGLFPGSSFRLTIRNPAGDFVDQETLASDSRGNFNDTWRISQDAITEVYTIFLDGTGTFDDALKEYVSLTKFSVTPATLTSAIVEEPRPSYQRTETAQFTFSLKYPDGSPVVKSKQNSLPVLLTQNQTTVAYSSVTLVDETNGVWQAAVKIPVNATASSRYRFTLSSMMFDDGFGNKGGSGDTSTDFFQVSNATLLIRSQVNGTQIQVPFGQIGVVSKITYPDGTPMTNGTVRVLVSTGQTETDLILIYDPSIGAWRATYSSSLSDLWQVGTWKLEVKAADRYGNSGTTIFEISAQPYLFLTLIALFVAVVFLGRWVLAKYGRRTYLRLWKLSRRFRRPSSSP